MAPKKKDHLAKDNEPPPDPRLRKLLREDLQLIMQAGHNKDAKWAIKIAVQIMDHVEWTRSLEGKVTNNSYKVLDFEPADEAVFTDQAFDWRNYLNGVCVTIREGNFEDKLRLLFPAYSGKELDLLSFEEFMTIVQRHVRVPMKLFVGTDGPDFNEPPPGPYTPTPPPFEVTDGGEVKLETEEGGESTEGGGGDKGGDATDALSLLEGETAAADASTGAGADAGAGTGADASDAEIVRPKTSERRVSFSREADQVAPAEPAEPAEPVEPAEPPAAAVPVEPPTATADPSSEPQPPPTDAPRNAPPDVTADDAAATPAAAAGTEATPAPTPTLEVPGSGSASRPTSGTSVLGSKPESPVDKHLAKLDRAQSLGGNASHHAAHYASKAYMLRIEECAKIRFRQHDENEDGFLESDEFISLMSTDPQLRKYLSIDLNGYITDMTARDAVEKKSFGRKAFKDGIVNGWSTVF